MKWAFNAWSTALIFELWVCCTCKVVFDQEHIDVTSRHSRILLTLQVRFSGHQRKTAASVMDTSFPFSSTLISPFISLHHLLLRLLELSFPFSFPHGSHLWSTGSGVKLCFFLFFCFLLINVLPPLWTLFSSSLLYSYCQIWMLCSWAARALACTSTRQVFQFS